MRAARLWMAGLVVLVALPVRAPLFDNLGNHHHKVTTHSQQAQRYFDDLKYTLGIWHYTRGLALAALQQPDDAAKEQAAVAAIADAMPADRLIGDNTPAKAVLQIAAETLDGELAARRTDSNAAVRHLEAAVRLQDTLPYTEPPPWYYPARQSLDAVLLGAGRPAEAEVVYREDLRRNPDNGWSLYGLAQSLRAQGKEADAAKVDAQFRKAWANADVQLTASRF